MFHWFHRSPPISTFYVLLVMIICFFKKARNIYISMLEVIFLGDDVIDPREDGRAGGRLQ